VLFAASLDGATKEIYVHQCSEIVNGVRVPKQIVNLGPSLEGDTILAITDEEAFKILFNDELFPKKIIFYSLLEMLIGKGLVTSSGKLWLQERRILTPMFHFQQLKNYQPLVNQQTEIFIQKLKDSAGTKVSAVEIFSHHTFRIINETTFGGDFDSDWMTKKWHEALVELEHFSAFSIFLGQPFAHYLCNLDQVTKEIRTNVTEVIRNRKNTPNLEARKDLLAQMIKAIDPETGEHIPDDLITSEALTFLFAGHETTSNLLQFTMYYLTLNPAYQQKLQKEVDNLLGNKYPTNDDLPNLKMCKGVLYETMRLCPVVASVPREASKDIELCGKVIPKGTSVFVNIIGAHYNPKNFPDPEIFRAERFVEDRESNAYSYLPFIAGPRNCIGQKLAMQTATVTLAVVMQNFNVELFDLTEKVKIMSKLTSAAYNLNFKFIPRK